MSEESVLALAGSITIQLLLQVLPIMAQKTYVKCESDLCSLKAYIPIYTCMHEQSVNQMSLKWILARHKTWSLDWTMD